jgi:hypothetical protein
VLLDFRRRAQHVREIHAEEVDAVDDRPPAESALLTEETRQLFEDALVANAPADVYYVVVDSADGSKGPFTLSVSFD